jgi:hypothetical protein
MLAICVKYLKIDLEEYTIGRVYKIDPYSIRVKGFIDAVFVMGKNKCWKLVFIEQFETHFRILQNGDQA